MSNIAASRWILLLFLALCAVWDICLEKIPNELTVCAGIAGFGMMPGPGTIVNAMLVLLVFAPLVKIKAVGGGDAKMFSVMSVFLGMPAFLKCLAWIFIVAGGISLIKIISAGSGLSRLENIKNYIFLTARLRRLGHYGQKNERLVIPLGICALLGYAAFLISEL